MPDYLLSINNQVLLCYFISKNPVSKSKGDKEMKSKSMELCWLYWQPRAV